MSMSTDIEPIAPKAARVVLEAAIVERLGRIGMMKKRVGWSCKKAIILRA